jgi:hypothetical protein
MTIFYQTISAISFFGIPIAIETRKALGLEVHQYTKIKVYPIYDEEDRY